MDKAMVNYSVVNVTSYRDKRIDIVKGLCIILMVVGHAILGSVGSFYSFFSEWIYLFHMAAFYIASGFCFKDSKITDKQSLMRYLWRKIKTLYIPYVLINVLCLALNNVFVSLHLYGPEYYLDSFPIISILKTFVFLGGVTPFGGATWFIRTLFIISVVYAVISFLLKDKKVRDIVAYSLAAICILIKILSVICNFGINDIITKCLDGYVFLVLGTALKKFSKYLDFDFKKAIIVFFVSFGVLIGLVFLQRQGLKILNLFISMLCGGCVGWFMVWSFACICNHYMKHLASFLSFIGIRTMIIVLWHFIFFKPVSLLYIGIKGLSIARLADNPVLMNTGVVLWIVYTIVSIAMCLLLKVIYDFCKIRFIKAFRKKGETE